MIHSGAVYHGGRNLQPIEGRGRGNEGNRPQSSAQRKGGLVDKVTVKEKER